MINSKTFRLFISSTFSDFKREREVLQGKVFQHIKAYAAQFGYTFQPIDLRWGVSNEAQLDQKTLQLCLDEVKACKTFKYPNFLVMLGDRYGWIPLPYAIEALEFETLCALMTDKEKQDLSDWYMKDLNQLPASYILKERTGEFEAFAHWEKEERKLRGILQSAAEVALEDSKINSEQKKKYFTSATEAEVEEGIISYLKPTPSQNELMEGTQTTPEIDAQHVFGFFRSIEPSSRIDETFIAGDADKGKAKAFSDSVSGVLEAENRLHVEVKQVEKDKLDETYLQEFQERVTQFLESKIDEQKEQEEENEKLESPTPLKIEQKEQEYFAKDKCKNFLGQKDTLKAIEGYISDDTESPFNPSQPLVIYGKSGCGKSALMAKTIELTLSNKPKRVLYRFVGGTANSSSSVDILTSMLSELRVEVPESLSKSVRSDFHHNNNELINELSDIMCSYLATVESELIIFIDAVDQLQNIEQFLWVPERLPSKLKIIISTLNDPLYEVDCKAFNILKTITTNFEELGEFNEPEQLICKLLNQDGRTIQKEQKAFFLSQFKTSPTPFFVNIAAQEMKRWRSDELTRVGIADDQQKLASEYIGNLVSLYHHNEEFVFKVLSYLSASVSGLSEYELFELLASDTDFIEHVAPQTWHENITHELPVVHWARLQNHLMPLINFRLEEGVQLLYISNRDFCHAIINLPGQKEQHEALIKSTQHLIKASQKDRALLRTEWDMLYARLITEYLFRYNDKLKHNEFSEFISTSPEIVFFWQEKYLINLLEIGEEAYILGNTKKALCAFKSNFITVEALLEQDELRQEWLTSYIASLDGVCDCYFQLGLDAQELLNRKMLVNKLSVLHKRQYSDVMSRIYISALGEFASCYARCGEHNQANENYRLQESIVKPLFIENPTQWGEVYAKAAVMIADSFKRQDKLVSLRKYLLSASQMIEPLFNENKSNYASIYTRILNYIADSYSPEKDYETALSIYKQVLDIRAEFYKKGDSKTESDYARALNNIASIYEILEMYAEADSLYEESLAVRNRLYEIRKTGRENLYRIGLEKLAAFHFGHGDADYSAELYEKALLVVKQVYIENKALWVSKYTNLLFCLFGSYMKSHQIVKALEIAEENHKECINYYGENQEKTLEAQMILNGIEKKIEAEKYKSESMDFEDYSIDFFDHETNSETAVRSKNRLATMDDIYEIAKKVSFDINEEVISLNSFFHGIGFIELSFDANRAFSMLISLENIPQYSGAVELLNVARTMNEMPVSDEVVSLINNLEQFMYIDEPIGTLR
ncbi:tetratricopeptide repeat protein [Shewanella ulleungensis]|uniref:tetratricopeptide repeat protein n=1 Tax=Shewanella ulleungensis TaxID=2282699 RepID=UPI003D7B64B0